MALYKIEWKSSAAKELRKLPIQIVARVVDAVASLAEAPRPDGVKKLSDTENTYRLRIGDYRIVYNIFDMRLVIEILRVRHRSKAYK